MKEVGLDKESAEKCMQKHCMQVPMISVMK